MRQLIECIPNFSEGRDEDIIRQITQSITSVEGISLLDVDPGASTNRTVVTFVGEPEAVLEAAFRGIKAAGERIDMRKQQGAHPRMGATDVCPLVPISGVSVEEAIKLAHRLASRVGEELGIPVYLYEYAATRPERQNLAVIRAGEYEGFAEKIYLPEWKPDYGPQAYHAKSGQTVIGVRDFLIAYNINLNTKSVRRANSVAFDIREKGRLKTEDGKPWGKKLLDKNGEPVREAGACKHVKAIGWYVEEYGVAQVSANLTNIRETPLHEVFEAARKSAQARGLRVTGSELVGLLPKKCLTDAAMYYLEQQGVSRGMPEADLIQLAIKSLGLDELAPFDPQKKVIEYAIGSHQPDRLVDMSLREFADQLSTDAPAPGGGSAAALAGALGAGLGAMVANLSGNKRGWDERVKEFDQWAIKAQQIKDRLLNLIDEDTDAFNQVLHAYRLPKNSDAEKQARLEAIEMANKGAALTPFGTIETAFSTYEILDLLVQKGLKASVTDAAVGALLTHTAIEGAALNVLINLDSIKDKVFCEDLHHKTEGYRQLSAERREQILSNTQAVLG